MTVHRLIVCCYDPRLQKYQGAVYEMFVLTTENKSLFLKLDDVVVKYIFHSHSIQLSCSL